MKVNKTLLKCEGDVASKRLFNWCSYFWGGIFFWTFFCFFSAAHAFELKSHKNGIFNYPKILKSFDNGDYRIIDYQELRDINKRDDVPERRVKRKYVDYAAKRRTKKAHIDVDGGKVNYYYVGNTHQPDIITIYIHGKGGTGKQGINDFSFGGNFNRIKMLMLKNNGLYLSPDALAFGPQSAANIKSMILQYSNGQKVPEIVIACGSAGGEICHRLANDPSFASKISGVLFLGSYWDAQYKRSIAVQNGTKTYIAHGSRDTIFPIDKMEQFYRDIRRAGAGVKMVRLETGTHGTPIRMIDWREAINWILRK